jgi:hypothetical protein
MKLVPEAKNWWKMASNWAFGAIATAAAVLPAYSDLPPEVQSVIPPSYKPLVIGGLAVLGIVARLVKQRSVDCPPKPEPGTQLPGP